MKRMLATKFVDYVKNLFSLISIDIVTWCMTIASKNTRFSEGGIDLANHNIASVGEIHARDAVFNTANIFNLTENADNCGAIFNPMNVDTNFEKFGDIHASNLGTIARGYFKVKAGRTIPAGTDIYQTNVQSLHDAVLGGDVEFMPYTHLLCKVRGGSIFWLTMTASGRDNVLLSANIDLTAGMDCYVIAAVQSSSLDAA